MGIIDKLHHSEVRQFLEHRGFDVEAIKQLLEDHIALMRETDSLYLSTDKHEYYKRELKYSKAENFLLTLK